MCLCLITYRLILWHIRGGEYTLISLQIFKILHLLVLLSLNLHRSLPAGFPHFINTGHALARGIIWAPIPVQTVGETSDWSQHAKELWVGNAWKHGNVTVKSPMQDVTAVSWRLQSFRPITIESQREEGPGRKDGDKMDDGRFSVLDIQIILH